MMKHQWLYLSLFLVGVAIIAVIAFYINGCQEAQERNVDPSDVPELPPLQTGSSIPKVIPIDPNLWAYDGLLKGGVIND